MRGFPNLGLKAESSRGGEPAGRSAHRTHGSTASRTRDSGDRDWGSSRGWGLNPNPSTPRAGQSRFPVVSIRDSLFLYYYL